MVSNGIEFFSPVLPYEACACPAGATAGATATVRLLPENTNVRFEPLLAPNDCQGTDCSGVAIERGICSDLPWSFSGGRRGTRAGRGPTPTIG